MQPNRDQLNKWIASFPYDDLLAELTSLQQQVQALNTRMFALQDLKQMYERVKTLQTGRPEQELPGLMEAHQESPVTAAVAASVKPRTLREAVLSLMTNINQPEWNSE